MAVNQCSLQNGYMHNKHLLTLFLIQGRVHCFRFLFSFICSWLRNKPAPAIINNPISFFKKRAFYINLDFCFEKRLFLKYFTNNFKIF